MIEKACGHLVWWCRPPLCDACVAGRGQEAPHHHVDTTGRTISIISFGYFFVTSDGMYTRREWGQVSDQPERSFVKVLVVHDSLNKYIFAHVVDKKMKHSNIFSTAQMPLSTRSEQKDWKKSNLNALNLRCLLTLSQSFYRLYGFNWTKQSFQMRSVQKHLV